MLQELTTATGAQLWAIGSMLFFILVFALMVLSILGKNRQELERCSQMPLDDEPPRSGDDAELPVLPGRQGE